MKSKGAIQVFSIALAIACLFYMSFSVVTSLVESDAKEYAENTVKITGDVEVDNPALAKAESAYLDSMMREDVYDLGFVQYTYSDCKKQKLNLGLDLQGGMHVTLEIALDKLITRLSGGNENVKSALTIANQQQQTSQEPYVNLFATAYASISDGESLFRAFDTQENIDKFDRTAEDKDAQVIAFINNEAEEAIERTKNIIRTRIDEFGVVQPTIRQEGSTRITIELPGVDDAERIRKLIKRSAKLDFWETYESAELVNNYFVSVNEVLVDKLGLDEETTSDSDSTQEGANAGDDAVAALLGDDEEPTSDSLAEDTINAVDALASETSDEFPDTTNMTKEEIDSVKQVFAQKEAAQKFPLYQLLQPPVQNNQISQGPIAGYAVRKDTQKIMEYLRYEEVKRVLPSEMKFMWDIKPIDEKGEVFRLIALKAQADGKAPLDGSAITDAFQTYDQISGEPEVSMKMNPRGAMEWKNLTGANVGNSIAISLDNRIYSFPNVNEAISGGSSSIAGSFTIAEAKDLASVLKAGKLPVTVDIVEEETVGPTLGAASIKNGLTSLIAGLVLVLIFMIVYYNKGGVVANIALVANLFFIVGILASFHAALTLPGMAGIVLTIGMSVDANVLIFERIREELKAGKGIKLAISDGYKNAYSSIIDANLTTLLTGLILLFLGKGPISGFAIILVIGILTSLFCSIFLTRLIFEWMLKREQNIKFGSESTMKAFQGFNWNFIGKRKVAYAISGIVIVAGMVSLMTRGLNLSVDFEGGRSYIVAYEGNQDIVPVRDALTAKFGSAPEVKTFGGDNKHKITTKYRIEDKSETVDTEVESVLKGGLDEVVGAGTYKIEKSQKSGPTFARDIKEAAIKSIVIGLIAIFLYVVVRFRKWQYGLGALLALSHDVLFVLGLFSLFWGILPFNLEVDQAFIAAILTVVGYSINDTVVVFDRIRESLTLHTKAPLKETINGALNKTVSRTFITSLTTLFVILILFIFGGEILRGFSFALLVGVLVGTYSSLFIATPVVVDFDRSGR